jgi:serpin B
MKRKMILSLIALIFVLMTLPGCQGAEISSAHNSTKPVMITPVAFVTKDDIGKLVSGNNEFALDLYARFAGSEQSNFVFSPYSISTALAITYDGARGETASQMADALHFSLSESALPTAFRDLQKDMEQRDEKEDKVQLDIANALWGQKGEHFLSEYIKLINDYYDGGFGELNFSEPEVACKEINDWFSDNTNNNINDLLHPDDVAAAVLVITNALYFKGTWASVFDGNTAEDAFYLLDGTKVTVPMMKHGVFPFEYVKGDDYQAFTMQYDKIYNEDGYSMTIILPDEGQFNSFDRSLDAKKLDTILGSMQTITLSLNMPKFDIDSSYVLNQTLQEMGMTNAFGNADFSGIDGTHELFITHVGHGASISIDENGTEASAGTAVVVAKAVSDKVVVNRPFIFLIRDNKTGTILFLGRVLNPIN